MLKVLIRKLPPIARRDARLRRLKEQNDRLRAQSSPWGPPSRDRAIEVIRESGLFDARWYLSQIDDVTTDLDPVEHYVDQGQRVPGVSPHPAFVPDWYLEQHSGTLPKGSPVRRAPFLHYLTWGAARGLSPHPLFDAASYRRAHPGSGTFPGGPVAHFITKGQPLSEAAGATGAPWDAPDAFLAQATATAELIRDTRGFSHVERDVPEFDLEEEARVKDELRRRPLPSPPPLVSVVVPSKDREVMLARAIDSVRGQSYPHLELIVVDDGSQDGTPELLERCAREDDRLVVVRHDQARGVAAARNAALDRATGQFIAYLDSDNTWSPDFLELMVRHLTHTGDRAAYAVTELVEEGGEGRHLYRGLPFDRAHLRERNYIDCIVLVHERALLERTGGFDESLRRNVDWDLFLRLADETDFGFVPVRATQYDVWTEQGERITTLEPMAYRYVVRQRALVDLAGVRARADERVPGLLSVVLVVSESTAAATVLTGVERMRETATGPLEVVVVDSRTDTAVFTAVDAGLSRVEGVTVHRLTQPLPMEVVRNVGVQWTTGEQLAFMPSDMWTQPGWDAPLRDGLAQHAVVQPLVLTPGGAVWSAGLEYTGSGHWYLPWSGFPGDAPEVRSDREVSAVTAAAFAVRAVDYLDAGGLEPLLRDDLYGGDLSLRIGSATGRSVACLPGSVMAWRNDPPEGRSASALMRVRDNQRLDRQRWQQIGRPHRPAARVLQGYQLVGFARERNTQPAPRPLVVHDRPSRPLRWAIKIGAPTVERRTNWGDWHFAQSLRDSLELLGHEVTIDCKDEWYRPTAHLDDVVLQVRGVSIYEVNPGHTNIAWVISHPDRVTASELVDYDLVFGASSRWCASMSRRMGRPIEPMLQCTDHRRFRPVQPDPRRAHDVLVVANARGVRHSVAAALHAGIVPSVYGLRWGGLLPEGAWQGPYIPNSELPGVYAAAGVVLNDHWDDMRELGLLSNRLFDLAACDARVVSDYMPEVEEVFGDVVLTYGPHREIGDAVRQQLQESPERAQARRDFGERVRSEHTFDARALQLSEAALGLRAREGLPIR
ncbi:glycosyltransferase [Serinicoccus sp. CUA-874]|uniref:glycosyltransferase n=1 Tax=Serinicoccus sp. CUA-874 TaxID=1517939 RepID=UPI001300D155|nr:glycosyltransferase [Serinicoccus sp. CUA-874]